MSNRKARSHSAEEEENLERWLLTYADLITLLMAFFIILFSMSRMDLRKFEGLMGAVRTEFSGSGLLKGSSTLTPPTSHDYDPGSLLGQMGMEPSVGLRHEVEGSISDLLQGSGVTVVTRDKMVIIRIPTTETTFVAGSAELSDTLKHLLRRLAPPIRRYECRVRIEGHSCNLPLRSSHFADNWELSAARAGEVGLFLIRQMQIKPDQLATIGYADTRPLAANSDEAGRRLNRRVEIVLEAMAVPEEIRQPEAEKTQESTTAGMANPRAVDIRPDPVDVTGSVQ